MKILATMLTSAAFLALAAPAFAADPKAQTGSVGATTDRSAVLRGQVTSNGLSLSIYFEYGKTAAYGSQTTPTSLLFSDTLAIKTKVTGLDPSTEYHYRVVAGGILDTLYGQDASFKTPASGDGNSNAQGNEDSGTTTVSTGDLLGTDATAPDGSTQTGDDSGANTAPGGESTSSAKPELGQKVVAGPASGTVGIKSPGASGWATLAGNAPVPVGSIVDARRGTVQLVTALPGGATQTGTFHGSMFQVRQPQGGHGMTDLVLRGGSFAACRSSARQAGAAHAAGRSRVVRRLWGSDHHGRFRTRGSNSIATVRGTSWVTTDRCDGTLTSVSQGSVSVRDLHAKRTVLVHAGHSYLARGRR